MMFLFKKKKLHVDAFISEKYIAAYQTAPIQYSTHFYPEWWKRLKNQHFDTDEFEIIGSAKACAGIIEFYRNSLTIPLWSDFIFKIDKNLEFKWQYSDLCSTLAVHETRMRAGFKENYLHIKHHSPWLLKSEKNIKFDFKPDYYNNNNSSFDVMPGVIDYYYQNTTNINFFVEKKPQVIFQEFGFPMANISARSEREILLKNHLIDEKEYNKISNQSSPISFNKKFFKRVKQIEKLEKQKKCPFGFGD